MAETIRDLEHARELAKALLAWMAEAFSAHSSVCSCPTCVAIFQADQMRQALERVSR